MEHVIAFRLARIITLLQILIIIFVIYLILYIFRWVKETYPSFHIFPRKKAAHGADREKSEIEAGTDSRTETERKEEK